MNTQKDLMRMRQELSEISEQEATRLYRLAWRATVHNCSSETIQKIREEACQLHLNGYPERLLDPFCLHRFEFAFKCK